jgi:predicted P-loop ATPase/GTPase
MFDEIDEGTAIFKVTNDPPVGGVNRWVDYEGLPSDFYLKLVGDATKELKRRTAEMRRNIVTDNPFAN